MKIYLTNLRKYNEGELCGKWVELPAHNDDLKEVLEEIGKNDEFFISDYEDSPVRIGEYDSIDYLNEIAENYDNLTEYQKEALEAFLDDQGGDFLDAVDFIKKGEWYSLENIKNEYDLGHEIFQEFYALDCKDSILTRYFDYKDFGNDLIKEDNWYLYEGKAYQFHL